MFNFPSWNGKPLIPSRTAQREMDVEGLDLNLLSSMLERARPSGRRRKRGVVEVVCSRGVRAYKIVLAESMQYSTRNLVWLVVHVKSVSL